MYKVAFLALVSLGFLVLAFGDKAQAKEPGLAVKAAVKTSKAPPAKSVEKSSKEVDKDQVEALCGGWWYRPSCPYYQPHCSYYRPHCYYYRPSCYYYRAPCCHRPYCY